MSDQTKITKLLADLRSADTDKDWTGRGGLMHLAADEIERLRADVRQFKEALYWVLGERDSLGEEPPPIAGKYRRMYWWRTELRRRCGLPVGGSADAGSPKPKSDRMRMRATPLVSEKP